MRWFRTKKRGSKVAERSAMELYAAALAAVDPGGFVSPPTIGSKIMTDAEAAYSDWGWVGNTLFQAMQAADIDSAQRERGEGEVRREGREEPGRERRGSASSAS